MRLKPLALAIPLIIISGCSGQIYTYQNADDACDKRANENDSKSKCIRYSGTEFHRFRQVTQVYVLTQITNEKGEVLRYSTGEGEKSCTAVELSENKTISVREPSVVRYEPGLLETSKFNLQLNASGNITSIGTESTPGGKTFADTVSTLVSTFNPEFVRKGAEPAPLCTTGKIPVKIVDE